MGVKKETSLQSRIQDLIEKRGGYVFKNWGNMTTEPGRADLTVCYNSIYIAIEVKEGDNKPSPAQGIHARKVSKSGGITLVAWSVEEVKKLLDIIDKDELVKAEVDTMFLIKKTMQTNKLDDGTRY